MQSMSANDFSSSNKEENKKLYLLALDTILPSNHNTHKSSFDLCFWASDPLIERF